MDDTGWHRKDRVGGANSVPVLEREVVGAENEFLVESPGLLAADHVSEKQLLVRAINPVNMIIMISCFDFIIIPY